MVNGAVSQPITPTYGPAAFLAALANIVVVEIAVWTVLPWFVLIIFVVPLLLLDLAAAAVLKRRPGAAGQIGHGMLIGLISAPLTVIVFLPGLLLAQAAGLV
ncbi:hypothetical protein [Mycolicibacterium baixiangningiae]|uniref:hypothetical protein n=1 Tax=Mycolicibacterium baixiangningiae TaxID=2761578 RepID=UPI0018667F44|nr:hypothetical protein [Mycolicibacterium baixiangningiae]